MTKKVSGPIQPHPSAEVYRTKTARIWVGDDEIVRVSCTPGAVHGLEEAKENLEAIPTERHKRRPVLVDIRHVAAVNQEARDLYRNPEANDIIALALLIESPLSRVIGNIFVGLSKMHVPVRLFTSEAPAVEWLKGLRDDPN